MKKSLIFLGLVIITLIVSCKKGDTGPEGPEGPAGPQGPQGIAGNGNVRQYTFAAHNFATNAIATLQVTTSADTMNQSSWHVYFVRASGNVYPIPGFGLNGASDYRLYWSYGGGKANFVANRISGPGEEYASIRIIRIYANSSGAGGRMAEPLPDIDYNNYQEVCAYYNLPFPD